MWEVRTPALITTQLLPSSNSSLSIHRNFLKFNQLLPKWGVDKYYQGCILDSLLSLRRILQITVLLKRKSIFWVTTHPFLGLLCRGYNPLVLYIEALYKGLLHLFNQCRTWQKNPDFITLFFEWMWFFSEKANLSCVYHVPFYHLKIENLYLLRIKQAVPWHYFSSKMAFKSDFFQAKAEHSATLAKRFAAIIGKHGWYLFDGSN